MRVLAIETSTMLGGIAIMDEDMGLVAEVRVNVKATHSERLMTELDYVLQHSALHISDIDALAISTGPGSFTGLRIGISTAKGLAFTSGLPVTAVPTLEAFAWGFSFSRYPVCPMLDARKKEVYAGVFVHEDGSVKRLRQECSIPPAMLVSELSGYEGVLFTGEGALIYKDVIEEGLGSRAHFAPPHLMVPSPGAVAYVGLRQALMGEFTDPAGLSPFYIRKSEAELKNP